MRQFMRVNDEILVGENYAKYAKYTHPDLHLCDICEEYIKLKEKRPTMLEMILFGFGGGGLK